MVDLFECQDYRAYVRSRLEGRRGSRSELAQKIGCQSAFVSQVLSELNHFNLEHGEKLNDHFGHSPEESHYFLLLIQYARAGTSGLRKYFEDQLKQVRDSRLDLKKRLRADPEVTQADQQTYYSSWYYSAIHACLGVPGFRTREAISRRLGLPVARVTEILEFLVSLGFAKNLGGEHHPTRQFVHLAVDSPLINKHHANWRIKTLVALEQPRTDVSFHYSLATSLSRKTALKIRKMLVESMVEVKPLIEQSEAEDLYSLNLDLFKI